MASRSLEAAYILHRRPYRETSLILDCFGQDTGRLSLLAKGAKRGKSKAGLLQPFQRIWIGAAGKGEMRTLTHSEPDQTGRFAPLVGVQLACGFYLNELLIRLLPAQESMPELFDLYASTIAALPGASHPDVLLRHFELGLLSVIGYGIELAHDADGKQVSADSRYRYHSDSGFQVVAGDSGFAGSTLLALADHGELPDPARQEARLLMRKVLAPYLGNRPLQSRKLLEDFR